MKILEKIDIEFNMINSHLNELKLMNILKEEEDILRNNKRFSNFIEGAIQIIVIFSNFNYTYENILQLDEYKKEDFKKIFISEKITKKISIFKNKSRKFIFEERIKDLLDNCSRVNTNINISNSYCNLCYTELKDMVSTNIFLYDFHITCINFWINCIDQHSPYQLI